MIPTLESIEQAIKDDGGGTPTCSEAMLMQVRDALRAGAVILSKEDREKALEQIMLAVDPKQWEGNADGAYLEARRLLHLSEEP